MIRTMNQISVSPNRTVMYVRVLTPKRRILGWVPLNEARQWRKEGHGWFEDRGRSIRLTNYNPRLWHDLTSCKVCGARSFQRVCPQCKRDGSRTT